MPGSPNAWKSKYGGMDVSEAQEAKRLRDENGRLRKLVADLSLDKEALQSAIKKKTAGASTPRTKTCLRGPRLTAMKASVEHIATTFAFTERRACRLLMAPISSYRYQPWLLTRSGRSTSCMMQWLVAARSAC